MDDATDLGLAGRPTWRQQPRNMLTARATAECCRLVAADMVLGLPYVVEELDDQPYEVTDPPDPPKKRTARRRTAKTALPPAKRWTGPLGTAALLPLLPLLGAKVPWGRRPTTGARTGRRRCSREPAPGVTPPPPPPAGPTAPPGPAGGSVVWMTNDQRKAMMAAYRELGITDRAERLRHNTAIIVGRTVLSLSEGSDITYGEARQSLPCLRWNGPRVRLNTPPLGKGKLTTGPTNAERWARNEPTPGFQEPPLWDDVP